MKKLLLITAGLLLFLSNLSAQLITSTPALPTDLDQTTIYFDASLGNQALKDFVGDVYAHTGVITNLSTSGSDWKYVIAGWAVNTAKAKMTALPNNKYQLVLTPSIREFYGVPAGETIQKLAFVFRNSDGSKQGKTATSGDIFYDVYKVGLAVTILSPETQPYFVDASSNFNIEVSATASTSTIVKIDDVTVHTENATPNSFIYNVSAGVSGSHWIMVEAHKDNEIVKDSMYYVVRTSSPVLPLPTGVHDGINYIDDNTVTLVLHAPFKNSVYAIGSFNNWQATSDYIMNRSENSTSNLELRFWITLTNLTAAKEYIFQYLVDESLKLADPYAEKISDPWNDKYISAETYPGLIAYPDGKTDGIASVFQTAQTPYSWKVSNFTPPKKSDLVIYELLVRDFTAKGNYQTLIDTLSYLKQLGINAIELMPINEFEGNSSWGYNPAFYFAPDKAYGTKNKLKEFVDSCHQNGIAVFMDMVLNHSYGQSPFVQLYFDKINNKPTAQNLWYNVNYNFQNTSAQWGYDFNHDSPYTRQLVDSINSYWMSQYKIDGFRFDFTKGFSNTPYGPSDWGSAYDASRISNLERMASEIWKRKDKASVIFEHLADNTEETVLANYGILLWGNMNYNYSQTAMGYSDGADISGTLYTQKSWSQPNLVSYMESHDEERLMYRLKTYGKATSYYDTKVKATSLKRVELASTFFLAFPGPKMLWQFCELGYDISIDQGGRVDPKPIKWDYYTDKDRFRLYQVLSALIKLKKEQDVFENGTVSIDVSGLSKRINLSGTDMKVTIIGNFDVVSAPINPNFQQTGTWYDYFTGDSKNVTNATDNITLAPGEYHIYTTVKLTTPTIITGVEKIEKSNGKTINLKAFPNPASNNININFNLDETAKNSEISIFNLAGQKVTTLQKGHLSKGEQHFEWNLNNSQGQKVNTGAYLLKINSEKLNENLVLIVK